jgi:hypothetical protein
MRGHSESEEYVIEGLSFYGLGARYQGKGILTWKAEEGFRIEAPVSRNRPLPERIELGRVGVRSPRDATTIRMRFVGDTIAISDKIYFEPNLRLLDGNHLSAVLKRVLFIDRLPLSTQSDWWSGSATYKVSEELILPDRAHRQVMLEDRAVEDSHSAAGLRYEDDKIRVVGHQHGSKDIELYWSLSKAHWTKSDSWRWPEEAQHALAFLSGQEARLARRETRRPKGEHVATYTEIRKRTKPEELSDFLKPIKKAPPLDRNAFIKLTEFLVKNPKPGMVCRKIFYQIADASRQKTWQGSELLLATILEAALRTLYNEPFDPRVYAWPVKDYLERFRKDYLADSWQDACVRALEVRKRLRDRNAHPDWLTQEGGRESKPALEQALDDVVFLSTFYGYMILAIAGFKDIEPKFPKPHKEWSPSMTITQAPPPKADASEIPRQAQNDSPA